MYNLRREEVDYYLNKVDSRSKKIMHLNLELWAANNAIRELQEEICYLQNHVKELEDGRETPQDPKC